MSKEQKQRKKNVNKNQIKDQKNMETVSLSLIVDYTTAQKKIIYVLKWEQNINK